MRRAIIKKIKKRTSLKEVGKEESMNQLFANKFENIKNQRKISNQKLKIATLEHQDSVHTKYSGKIINFNNAHEFKDDVEKGRDKCTSQNDFYRVNPK